MSSRSGILPAYDTGACRTRSLFSSSSASCVPRTVREAMKVQVRILLTTCLASAIASCGVSIQSESALTPGVDLGSLQTFAWDQEMDLPSGDPRLENNHFFLDRMHEAIEWELSLSGFRHDESSPDLLLHHHLTLADHGLPADSVIDDSGFVTTRPYSYEEGTVMVHAADPESGEDLWVAWGWANVEPALAKSGRHENLGLLDRKRDVQGLAGARPDQRGVAAAPRLVRLMGKR